MLIIIELALQDKDSSRILQHTGTLVAERSMTDAKHLSLIFFRPVVPKNVNFFVLDTESVSPFL